MTSLLFLFLELACIRWFPAHVLFLTFFTNIVLLACFLGMSVGCMTAGRKRHFIAWTPALLAVGLAVALGMEGLQALLQPLLTTGDQVSPQVVFFGSEQANLDVAQFLIPVDVIGGFFFLVIALALIGPGQELGRALQNVPNRVWGYSLNILGSIAGITLFAAFSWWELPPLWWFLPAVLAVGYLLAVRHLPHHPLALAGQIALLALVVFLASWRTGPYRVKGQLPGPTPVLNWMKSLAGRQPPPSPPIGEHLWSPYYRIDFDYPSGIFVNQIAHQGMVSTSDVFPAYALPHLLRRDCGDRTFEQVLIVGAGSGSDVSRALQAGARHVDAVEIDPVIYRLGRERHPDHPYQDARVAVHLDDGRNFLRSAPDGQYDLIVYALVDSLVLHSSYSNIRLESYLFTDQAFADVRRNLKPGGLFVMYNYFRYGWLVARLHQGLSAAFGTEPLLLTFPYREIVEPEQKADGFTIFLAGEGAECVRGAFRSHSEYWLAADRAPGLDSPNGFTQRSTPAAESRWNRFGLTRLIPPERPVGTASDDWPFLYLRRPMIPDLSWRGMAVIGSLSLLLLALLGRPQNLGARGMPGNIRMFFLGAGFMLVETKAVVHMALLFGSTWVVNSVVFCAVLVMILAANLLVLQSHPTRLWPYYAGLFVALVGNSVVPLDFFLGMPRGVQAVGSCLLLFAPILFAGVVFAASFARSAEPDQALGANIAGAMLGGLAEYSSMLVGFQHLTLVALFFYALSAVGARSFGGQTATSTRATA